MYIKRMYQLLWIILMMIGLYVLANVFPILLSVLRFVFTILSPFLVAGLISYFLHPLVKKLHKKNMNKGLAVTIIFTGFIAIVSIISYVAFPIILIQLQEFAEQMPKFFKLYETSIYSLFENTSYLPEIFHDKMRMIIQQIEQSLEKRLEHILNQIMNGIDFVFIFAIVPVLVIYILIDYERITEIIYKRINTIAFLQTNSLLDVINNSLSRYIKGQLIISFFITLITFLIYYTFQLKYALLLAFFMGIMNVIPYFGPIIGSIPAILIAFTMSWKLAIAVIVVNVLVQIIEGSFFSPYIMGKSVEIHPIGIIFVLVVGAELGGVIGMIFAVPLATIIKAIYKEILLEKQHSN